MAFDTSDDVTEPRPGLEIDESALLSYLQSPASSFPVVPVAVRISQFEHGQSNPSYLLEVKSSTTTTTTTTSFGSVHHRFVLRKKPPGKILRSAHAVEREFQVLHALGSFSSGSVPVPRVYCLCMDPRVIGTPFFVMDFVQGRIFTNPKLPDSAPELRKRLYSEMAMALAAIHNVDVDVVGLSGYGRRENYCQRQVERWAEQYEASTGDGGPDRLPSMMRLIDWLRSNLPIMEGRTGLVHGDYRMDNLIFKLSITKNTINNNNIDDANVVAVLDWELSTLGDTMSDVAYSCLPYHFPPGLKSLVSIVDEDGNLPAGIPTEQEYLDEYCKHAGVELRVESWTFYLALALFRAASILAGVYRRALQGNASATDANEKGILVGILADVALKIIDHAAEPTTANRKIKGTNELRQRSRRRGVGVEEEAVLDDDGVNKKGADGDGEMRKTTKTMAIFDPPSQKLDKLRARLIDFMEKNVFPNERVFEEHGISENKWTIHPLMEELKMKAKKEGLWNLWIPEESTALAMALLQEKKKERPEEQEGEGNSRDSSLFWESLAGAGLTNVEYAPLCEIMGRSVWAPEIFNCSAPDTGNMEVLFKYGARQQQKRWLVPLLEGSIRSCFAMTEPDVASSDATNIQSSITRFGYGDSDGDGDSDGYVLNGRKWWSSGAMDPRCQLVIFMGKTNPTAAVYLQQSMILVDMKSPGIQIIRPLTVFGYDDAPHGHAEIVFKNVRVPSENLLLGEGRGFEIAQGRLGPGRLHHCMRLIGMAERAMEAMILRANERTAFGKTLSEHGSYLHQLAESRIEIEQARLVVINAAHVLDLQGQKAARRALAIAKVVAPRAALKVLDRAIQVHGGGGVSGDFPLARLWITARTLRIADGPDEVHLGTIAKIELAKSRL